jgi:molybdate transport system substrate-binding protein
VGAELVGWIPPEIQLYTVYPAAVAAATKEGDAARALIKFLTSPAAIAVLKSKGLSPG